AFHNLCIVSIRKAFPGHARKVMNAIWGLGMLSLTKGIVVVDEHVDVHDYAEVMFYVGANVDPKRDVVLTEGPLDHLDHAPTLQFFGGKIGIDATAKGPLEGAREWPPELAMSDEVKARVDRRWAEYGIETVPLAQDRGIRQSSRRLLRRLPPSFPQIESRGPLSQRDDDHPHVPGPSLWPVGFAVGVVVLLVGLIISWYIAGIGALIALAFAFLWVRDLTVGTSLAHAPDVPPESPTGPALPAQEGGAAMPPATA